MRLRNIAIGFTFGIGLWITLLVIFDGPLSDSLVLSGGLILMASAVSRAIDE